MYATAALTGSLLQGDVCLDIPLPIILPKLQFVDMKAQVLIDGNVPTEEMLATRSQFHAVVQMVRSPVLVLSQSCDLDDAESKPNARIMVAPTLPDDDERFTTVYAAATKSSSDAFTKKLVTAIKSGNSIDTTIEKGKGPLEKVRQKALEDLWLGKLEGVFPLAPKSDIGLRRSICFFDNAVTLPSSWIPLLKKRRVLRLESHWADVLREQLAAWIGRFAFPGDKSARLAVGGLADEPSAGSNNVSEPVTQGAPT